MCRFILTSLRFKRFVACGLMIVATALTAQNSIAQQTQKRFKTAEEAVQSAIKAAKGNNMPELLAIFGADAEDLLSSGDKVADRRSRQVILVALNEKWSLTSEGANTRILVIGNEKWRYPIPLVKDSGGWRFDTSAGREEILFRRIGRNELSTIRACSVYVRVQKEYAAKSHDGKPAGLYAQRFASQPGKQDGLYWKVGAGEDLSPLGAFVAEASPEYSSLGVSGPTPFHGYLFRLLTAQGPAAPGGAKSYISNGEMTGGFALLAYPAEYRKSGVMAFIVNQDGVIYEKDLGEETVKVASQINEYNPDSSWRRVR
jgi:type II secretory pathway pseudopilin PulG